MRVPDYTVIVLHPERFAWSQIHYASGGASTQSSSRSRPWNVGIAGDPWRIDL